MESLLGASTIGSGGEALLLNVRFSTVALACGGKRSQV